jgi:hypothetical protein
MPVLGARPNTRTLLSAPRRSFAADLGMLAAR